MRRVVVVGSSNTDMTVRVPVLPAAGQTVLGDSFATTPGGKGADQAVAARRAGAEVAFVAAVGDDDLGRQAVERYRREGINVDHVRTVEEVSSGVALIFVSHDGENMIGVASGADQRLNPTDIDRLPDLLFRSGDILLAGLEIPIPTAIRAMRRGKSSGMTVILNPAPAPSLSAQEVAVLLSVADIITPNRVEAIMLAGIRQGERPEPASCARRLLELGPRAVVITLGAAGCLVAQDEEIHLVPSPRVEAVDTVGAGDAFNGALAVALAESLPLAEAAGWAARAAALAVTRPGAQSALPFREQIDQLRRKTTMTTRLESIAPSLLVLASLLWLGLGSERRVLAADRPYGPLHKTRSAVLARQGMAATSQPLATAAAIWVLQKDGNAVDAAIAANAVLGIVEPMSCGLGGDLFAIVWDARSRKLYGLNASGRSPAAASLALFRARGLKEIPLQGPLSWSIPGCVDGWDELRRKFGSRSWASSWSRRSSTLSTAFPSARSSPPTGTPPLPRSGGFRLRRPASCLGDMLRQQGRSSAIRNWRGRCG